MNKAFIVGLIAIFFILSVPPANAANFPQAVKLYQAKKYKKALAVLDECYKKYPNSTTIRYYLAMTYRQLGNVEQAKTHLKWIVENGDQSFKERAEHGYNELVSSKSSKPVKKEKVKKILDFYADW